MKFLVGYDDAAASRAVIEEARKHARIWGARIEIVCALERETPIKRSRLEEMESRLEAEIRPLFAEGEIPYGIQLEVDNLDAGESIVKVARRKKADLLFIGIRNKSRVGKLLFGSTAQYIILHSPCPVVAVHSGSLRQGADGHQPD